MSYSNNLNESERIPEDIVNYDPDNQPNEKKEIIPQNIAKILFCLNNYNNNLISSIKRDYPSEIMNKKNYSKKYYCINSKWMNYFLELYSYQKIKTLISEYKIESEEELYNKIKEKKIYLNLDYNTNIKNISSKKFEPEIKSISNYIFNVYKSGDLARYFDDFVLVDEILYDKLKQLYKNLIKEDCIKDEIIENNVEIYLVDNIFIYKVQENVLGIGIHEMPEKNVFPIFKIEFLIIINKKYINEEIIFNSDSEINEIFKSKDLETYLLIEREIKSNEYLNLNIIDMKFNNHTIGYIYNINDFNIEKYWKRTEEKYNKKMKSLEKFKGLEEYKRKKNNEILRKKEKQQDEGIEKTEKEKKLKLLKINKSLKETALRWSKNYNNFENQNTQNERYNDLPIIDKINENPDKGDKISVSTNITKDKPLIISKSPYHKVLLTEIKDNNEQTEENKSINLLQNNTNIKNSISVKIINTNEINNNKNFISSNLSNTKYRLGKLHKNKYLDGYNFNFLTKKQQKTLKMLAKKEKIKKENREKREEKEEQERIKKKQENEEKQAQAQKRRENMESKEREKNRKCLKRNNYNFYYK